jgi:hypothetical protein
VKIVFENIGNWFAKELDWIHGLNAKETVKTDHPGLRY